MILPTHPRNIDSATFDVAELTSSYMRQAPQIALPSTLFKLDLPHSSHSNLFNRSDLPPLNHKKIGKKLLGEFLLRDICRRRSIKDFLPKQASFYKYTWDVITFIVITGEGCLSPDIWLETLNQATGTNNIILII